MAKRAKDSIRFRCGNGHKIKASVRLEGRVVNCPSCRAKTLVPLTYEPPASLSESGAVRLLNECEEEFAARNPIQPVFAPADPRQSDSVTSLRVATFPPASTNLKKCPRCKTLINSRLLTCSNCSVLLASMTRGFRNACRDALKAMTGK